jgi:hypothetical protein
MKRLLLLRKGEEEVNESSLGLDLVELQTEHHEAAEAEWEP